MYIKYLMYIKIMMLNIQILVFHYSIKNFK